MLKSSLQKFYGRHNDLVDSYEISISQMTMDLFPFNVDFIFPLSLTTFTGLDYIYMSNV
jgi:hypothetical protein